MTTSELQKGFTEKANWLFELREAGTISDEEHHRLLNEAKQDTFFAVSVLSDIDNINENGVR